MYLTEASNATNVHGLYSYDPCKYVAIPGNPLVLISHEK